MSTYDDIKQLEDKFVNVELLNDNQICDDVVKLNYFIKILTGLKTIRENTLSESTKNNDTDLKDYSIKFKSSNLQDKDKLTTYFNKMDLLKQELHSTIVINFKDLKSTIESEESKDHYKRYFTKRSSPRIDIKKHEVRE